MIMAMIRIRSWEMIIDENNLIEDFSTLIRLPLPDLKKSIWHYAQQLKNEYINDIKEYHKLQEIIVPGKENEAYIKPVKQIRFELCQKKGSWKVQPADIPGEIVNLIVGQDAYHGYNMRKLTIKDGRTFIITFEKHTNIFITGTIREKKNQNENEKRVHLPSVAKNHPPSISGKISKVDSLKTLLSYLMNHEKYFNSIIEEFNELWKPLLDSGAIRKKELSKDNFV
jgi:hypothetical protein